MDRKELYRVCSTSLCFIVLTIPFLQAIHSKESEFNCRSLGLSGECEEVEACTCVCFKLTKWSTTVEAAYFGELGYELVLYSPYIYYLHILGKLKRTLGPPGSSAFNYFSPNHTELPFGRRFCPGLYSNKNAHAAIADFRFDEWVPPQYKQHFQGKLPALSELPLLILHNKYTKEWDQPPANFIDVPTLLQLIDMLKGRYTIVYMRPYTSQHLPGYVGDSNLDVEFNDHEEIKRQHPEVHLAHELLGQLTEVNDFNELQLALHAQSDAFISVLGGNAVIASYFAGTNIVYAVKGQETTHNDEFGVLYPRLSPEGLGKVVHARNYGQLLALAEQHFLSESAQTDVVA
ncbi:hypothetical protein WJX84_011002 [Apatococcus fuscideae]|uniref:Uncharacterized protein n=1 Tax=Apatococcus fuscideae TaxID=2026836 RepID=A0AAW1T394_9CHLO